MRRFKILLTFIVISSNAIRAPHSAEYGECLDFDPGINYYNFEIDKTPDMSTSFAVTQGLLSVFSEQISAIILSEDDDYFKKYVISNLYDELQIAFGVGRDVSPIFSPQTPDANNSDIDIIFIPSAHPIIAADRQNIYVTGGLLRNVVLSAIREVFETKENYKKYLENLHSQDYNNFLKLNGIEVATNKEKFTVPIGYILYGKEVDRNDKIVSDLRQFTDQFLSKLLFAAAHEIGHIRLGHADSKYKSCADFEALEFAADKYASQHLARFVFRIQPDQSMRQSLIDFVGFFENYEDYGFSNKSTDGDCDYPPAAKRSREIRKSVYRETVRLLNSTYSSPDYTTPDPVSVICSNEKRTWRVYFGDKNYVSTEEMRRRSIEQNQKYILPSIEE